jgi:hypothetical protein
MKHYYKKSNFIKKNVDDTNINYFENYEDLNYKYEHYKNKSLLDVINIIYEEDELKLNDEFKLTNVDEYKLLIRSLISTDFKHLKVKKNENIRLKMYNHLNEESFTLKDLLRFLNMVEPIFYKKSYFYEKNTTYASAMIIYNMFVDVENIFFEKWKLKYLIFIFKIYKLFDVPILENHNIKNYWMNKYNFEQHREFIEYDLCRNYDDCGTFEKMGPASLYYYKNKVEDDENNVKNNQYPFINKIIFKYYNNLFVEIKQMKQIKPKQKIINSVSVF